MSEPGAKLSLEKAQGPTTDHGFIRELGLLDATMLVAGSMIGSGIFIVSADIARQVGSPGWLLMVWVIAGALTLIAALSYGELAGMMPRAGGQYIYLREALGPMWAFLYGWTLFVVIQTGTIAAVAIAFARFMGVLWPSISPNTLLFDYGYITVPSIGDLSLSLSSQQLVAILSIVLLTLTNLSGLRTGKIIQDVFTVTKVGALLALIGLGLFAFHNPQAAIHAPDFWTPIADGRVIPFLVPVLATAMVGALFSADAWNNVTFTGAEVKDPHRNLPLSMALGTGLVILLYLLANLVYLAALPMNAIQQAPEDRVGVAVAQILLGEHAQTLMAIAIMISCFGCNNGLILAGARVYFSMARDGLFFAKVGTLNKRRVPGTALLLQGVWSVLLTLPRTYHPETQSYSNLYSNLLDYIVFAVLLFYILTVAGIFALRRKWPEIHRPYRALGFPVLPALYMAVAGFICLVLLFADKTRLNAGIGLALVLTGWPVYWLWRRRKAN
ncbi:MAG: APC family permease [Gammaproteobacteria bacterium]